LDKIFNTFKIYNLINYSFTEVAFVSDCLPCRNPDLDVDVVVPVSAVRVQGFEAALAEGQNGVRTCSCQKKTEIRFPIRNSKLTYQ
jgi:hypothetical protein